MNEAPVYTATPVLDIVSFGYRRMFQNIKPLLKVMLPFVVVPGILTGLTIKDMIALQSGTHSNPFAVFGFYFGLGGIALFSSLVLLYYGNYVVIRYLRDLYRDTLQTDITYYMKPQRDLLSYVAIFFLIGAGFSVVYGLLILGIILSITIILAIIGIPLFLASLGGLVFLLCRFSLVLAAYGLEPERGVFGAFGRSWAYTRNNFWRTLGLVLIVFLIQIIVMIPFGGLQEVMMFMGMFQPSYMENLGFPLIYGLLFMLHSLAQTVIGVGGWMSTAYRYFYDLKYRQENLDANGIPLNLNADTFS